MAHNHKAARRHSFKSSHPNGTYYRSKGGGPGRYAKGESATTRNKAAREQAARG